MFERASKPALAPTQGALSNGLKKEVSIKSIE